MAVAAIGAAALAASVVAAMPAATADNEIPPVDAIVTSPNMHYVANIPQMDPLAGEGAFSSDLAFTGDFAIQGNYNGFIIYNIKNPKKPRLVSQVFCPGSQNDVSVQGNLLFLSTDSRRSNNSCASDPQNDGTKPYWEGMKIFDISDKSAPRYLQSVETDCGSHTHTLVPDNQSSDNVYIYVSSYSPSPTIARCQPPHDYISIIKVPLKNPAMAAVVQKPVLFPDGGNPGDDPATVPYPFRTSATSGCHDLTVYPEKNLMAGACMGDGVLFDITNREAPRTINRVEDNENFAFWHSATFNNEGTKVIFTDELGGGGTATCNPTIGPLRGADGVYDITGTGDARTLVFRSYFKIPRRNADTENCVAHNGSLIPVKGKDIMVQSWYQGGTWVWDFTDSANPKVVGFVERGPLSDTVMKTGGTWSSYWYNGQIYSSDITKGFDVVDINDPLVNQAKSVHLDVLNVQTQGHFGR
jgi:hypothetical protein